MLTIERIATEVRRLPTLVKIGVVALALSSFADVISHVDTGLAIDTVGRVHEFSPAEATSHLAILVSMVLIFAGVVADGVRRSHARRRSVGRNQKGVA